MTQHTPCVLARRYNHRRTACAPGFSLRNCCCSHQLFSSECSSVSCVIVANVYGNVSNMLLFTDSLVSEVSWCICAGIFFNWLCDTSSVVRLAIADIRSIGYVIHQGLSAGSNQISPLAICSIGYVIHQGTPAGSNQIPPLAIC